MSEQAPFPRLCRDCKYSEPDPNSTWLLKCHNPAVNSRDNYALASTKPHAGTDCSSERGKAGWLFDRSLCGMHGALWEAKVAGGTGSGGGDPDYHPPY